MDTGYSSASTPVSGPVTGASDAKTGEDSYWELGHCKKAYLDYLFNKTQEIEEQKSARRYYHGSHWTEKQIKELNKRKQPVVTFNRIGRKVDGVVGLIERLRQDPKAYARTPEHEQGADLATAVLRYVLDEEEWKAKSPEVARDCAVDGIAGVELVITQGDQGDPEVSFDIVEPDSFFYDPRSYRPDFSDARYMGVGKWMDMDAAIEMFPDKEAELNEVGSYTSELSSNPDREKRWFTEVGTKRLVRLVEIWYRHKGEWCWTIFTGYSKLKEGKSYFVDNKKKTACKYVMFSCNVDHDGDRYGFVRNMKSAQDEYNHRRSKALHQLNSKRLILTQNSVTNIETTRTEWARPDGVIVVPTADVNASVKADDQSFDFAGQLKLMENAIAELENYGPNQALVGDQQNQSGRAIQLLQQAGMAELGPYILGYRGWKLRLYRAIWNAVQKFWTGERWIRVTDNQDVANFVALNKQQQGPMGQPVTVNQIGSLDVDIIIDEGPDTVTAQMDTNETLMKVLPTVAPMLTPPQAQAALSILIETSALPSDSKKTFRDASKPQQPDPMAEQAKQIELQGAVEKVKETASKTELNHAKAMELMTPEQVQPGKPAKYEPPPHIQDAKAVAEIGKTQAQTDHLHSQTAKNLVETALAPHQAAHQQIMDHANLTAAQDAAGDRKESESTN